MLLLYPHRIKRLLPSNVAVTLHFRFVQSCESDDTYTPSVYHSSLPLSPPFLCSYGQGNMLTRHNPSTTSTLLWDTVRVKKNDADIRNAFPKCVYGAAPAANWKASSGNRRLLPKKRKASSEERWVWTHISFRNVVQLHLRIFRGCVCVFRSCVCVFRAALITEKQNSNGKVSANARQF